MSPALSFSFRSGTNKSMSAKLCDSLTSSSLLPSAAVIPDIKEDQTQKYNGTVLTKEGVEALILDHFK